MARAHISDRTKLAALVCEFLEIPHEHQLLMHEDQVLSLVHWDHYPVPKALGGSDRFSNLRALLRSTHRAITAKRDVPTIAKVKRLARVTAEGSRRLLAKLNGEPSERKHSRWQQGRKLQSRNNLRRRG
jgi:hypothetical protein